PPGPSSRGLWPSRIVFIAAILRLSVWAPTAPPTLRDLDVAYPPKREVCRHLQIALLVTKSFPPYQCGAAAPHEIRHTPPSRSDWDRAWPAVAHRPVGRDRWLNSGKFCHPKIFSPARNVIIPQAAPLSSP